MGEFSKKDFNELLKKYGGNANFQGPTLSEDQQVTSVEYQKFKEALMPKQLNYYEKACQFVDKLISPPKPKNLKKWQEMQDYINICHLDITPGSVQTFGVLFPSAIMFIGAFVSYIIFNSGFFAFFFILLGLASIYPLMTIPKFMADHWRMKASNQMVLCVFYIVTYMRHTSNLERAIAFAADHLEPPLSLDMRKVVWDVQTEKYPELKESLENYLESWRKYNMEFIEAIHLIESSLYEGSEERRLQMLDKSLDVILTETYEKMLHYAHSLQSPITALHMMGVILPILGLVILPLVVSFMGNVEWYHIAAMYNVLLPAGVFYFGKKILASRPGGYGSVDISDANPEYKKLKFFQLKLGKEPMLVHPGYIAGFIFIICMVLAFSPLFIAMLQSDEMLLNEKELIEGTGFKTLEYRMSIAEQGPKVGKLLGPYGIVAGLFSFFFPLGIGFSLYAYYNISTSKLMEIRKRAKSLETEFASAIFQLGNRLGDGIPAEKAFGQVSKVMEGTESGKFFQAVSDKVLRLGLNVEEAIFHPKYGALLEHPSAVISSSMKVLVESVRKGPTVAAESMLNIARYIKDIHRAEERLKDLLAEINSSMKSQISFMAPAISGIVIGITSMITSILGKLRDQASVISSNTGQSGQLSLFTQLFGDALPTYFFQLVVGLYVVEIVIVLTILSNTIENGDDKLNEANSIGNNLKKSVMLYCILAAIVMVLFNFIAGQVAGRVTG